MSSMQYKSDDGDKDFINNFEKCKIGVQLSQEQISKYYEWCEGEVHSRVNEIILNKFRNAYERAAELVALLAEATDTLNIENKYKVVESFKKKYPKHRSFKGKLLEYESLMKRKIPFVQQCYFCCASVGEISERTNKVVKNIYYCHGCGNNCCDQCSYSEIHNDNNVQLCLRCDSKLEFVGGTNLC